MITNFETKTKYKKPKFYVLSLTQALIILFFTGPLEVEYR